MITKSYEIKWQDNLPSNFTKYFGNKNFAVLDIETTGLSKKKNAIILIGLVVVKDNKATLYQYFAEKLYDEKAVVESTVKLLEDLDFIITFNGKSFDLPFIKEKTNKYNIPFADIYNLDIYQILKTFSDLGTMLPDLKQKTVEKFMGFGSSRLDEISGGESVMLYNEYLVTGDKKLEEFILLHNSDDIEQLYKLIPVIKYADFHRAMSNYGFLTDSGAMKVSKIRTVRGNLVISGTVKSSAPYIAFPTDQEPWVVRMNLEPEVFEIEVPFFTKENYKIIDASKFVESDNSIFQLPAFESGYLILEGPERRNYMEINAFTKEICNKLESLASL